MLQHELRRDIGILIVTPQGPLREKDFEILSREVDPYIEAKGKLNGLMIHTKTFPGWVDFAAIVSHFKFVINHQQHIARVAVVTDNGLFAKLPRIVNLFVRTEIRHFDYGDKENALKWLCQLP